ncbi:hypothetical protein [Bacillus stratosphericus]|uniref:hypothetical protein n=1 Tax=Bacillus stratosphericus TaxID=293386 RepID=UPI001CFA11BE|nr:hypothetical protein [Bacillus stratosphericus]
MKRKKNRKVVTWRIEKSDPELTERLNAWCDSQKNVNQSLTIMVENLIKIFGYQDINNFEVQEVLHKLKQGNRNIEIAGQDKNSGSVPHNRVIDKDPYVDDSIKSTDADDILNAIDNDNEFFK